MPALFHLAFPVHDLAAAKRFYVDGLGCVGRESSTAMTLGLAGHQLTAHLSAVPIASQKGIYPRHFGLVLTDVEEWQALADRAKAKDLVFYQQPRRRFPGTQIEHRTFLEDPSESICSNSNITCTNRRFSGRNYPSVGDAGARAVAPGEAVTPPQEPLPNFPMGVE